MLVCSVCTVFTWTLSLSFSSSTYFLYWLPLSIFSSDYFSYFKDTNPSQQLQMLEDWMKMPEYNIKGRPISRKYAFVCLQKKVENVQSKKWLLYQTSFSGSVCPSSPPVNKVAWVNWKSKSTRIKKSPQKSFHPKSRWTRWFGGDSHNVAFSVNGPTSPRPSSLWSLVWK